MTKTKKYPGYRPEDYQTPHAGFFRPEVLAVQEHIRPLLQQLSPLPPGTLSALADIAYLNEPGYTQCENGYTLEPDGSARLAILTHMPGVTPPMWDWWFGWHGSQDSRYKLWHPAAHVSALWQDGATDNQGYIGRVSLVQEYIGDELTKANVQFISPLELGFTPAQVADKAQQVFICARLGFTQFPLDFGYLIHQVRATPNGAEMRSRFFLGGPHVAWRGHNPVGKRLVGVLKNLYPTPEGQVRDLLRHCAEEMNHLAAFLPKLYHTFNV